MEIRYDNETKKMKVKSLKVIKVQRRDSSPDIDLDFETNHRDDVKRYMEFKYGVNYTCAVGSYTRMKLKTCIKDFGRVKGITFDRLNFYTKEIDDQIEYSFSDIFAYGSKSGVLRTFLQEQPHLVHLTKFALLQARACSIHPSACVIVPKKNDEGEDMEIFDWFPVKKINGVLVSEWEGKYMETAGFLKEDILGLSQLDKFSRILNLIEENTGKRIDLENDIPLDDEKTFKYFCKGWNEDVFQFGTGGLKSYSVKVRPTNIEHLIAMNALFRPGPMESKAHEDFAEMKNGKKKAKFDYLMKPVTGHTQGLYVYQEQIMAALVVSGFTMVEADACRTYIKKFDQVKMAEFGDKFKAGMIEKGCGEVEAQKIWDKLLSFSKYGFNRSHSAAYSLMGYWSQYLKAHYPLEFWTASLELAIDDDIPNRISEIKRIESDIIIMPPDVNHSIRGFYSDRKTSRIFWGLEKIKGCGEIGVNNILATRGDKPFISLKEFYDRVPRNKVNKKVITNLILSGAFDELEQVQVPSDRKRVLESFLNLSKTDLSEEFTTPESNSSHFWTFLQKGLTGFGDLDYKVILKKSKFPKLSSEYISGEEFLELKADYQNATICGRFTWIKNFNTKNGKAAVLTIESNNSLINCLLWPDVYLPIEKEIDELKNKLVAVKGCVKYDDFRGFNMLYSNEKSKVFEI